MDGVTPPTTDAVKLILADNHSELAEAMTVARLPGWLGGAARRSCKSDLRLFSQLVP